MSWQTDRVHLGLRIATAFTCGIGVLVAAGPVAAAPTTACVVNDARLDEVSGLVATPTGYIAMNDGKFGTSVLRLYVLDPQCRVTKVITDRSFDPLDPEDLARTSDGTLWVADIGDNDRERDRVAINRIPPGSSRGTTYRLTYPDGAHDAEALLVQADRRAVLVTKALTGTAQIFVSTRPLTGPPATVPMRLAGSVDITPTDTTGGPDVGGFASTLVTGAALSPDGRRVVIRTYTDAYEWDVSDGDIAKGMTAEEPRRTPLPGEPQGEAITFTADGAGYLTTSEGAGEPIQRWLRPLTSTPTTPTAPASPSATASAARATEKKTPVVSPLAIGGLAAFGAVLILGGLVGLRRARRRSRR